MLSLFAGTEEQQRSCLCGVLVTCCGWAG